MPAAPRVSCIVLCTFNDRFVAERLVPSLLRASDMDATEIVVVDNGPEPSARLAGAGVRVLRSEPYHIPRGYNAGVAAARGRLVALFHDDCLLHDTRWVEKAEAALDEETWAVGPDLRVRPSYAYLKEVPLVMERRRFEALGGYDETRYVGYQADLLCIAIQRRGGRVAKVDIDCTHFCIPGRSIGMSTLLLASGPKEREALRATFASPTFSLADMEALTGRFENMTRARYLFDYLIVHPTEIYLHERYGDAPGAERPSPDRLVLDGVLPRMMPATREEMERMVQVLDYYNELFERARRARGADEGGGRHG
jgi:glycosyltransferase involved in cell wall biosynthesis